MGKQNHRTTLKDVAREVGLSFTTVSRILRGDSLFNEETVKKVQLKAKELNYRPNIMARALVNRGSSFVGLVLRDIGHSFFTDIIAGVQLELEEKGYSVILCNSSLDHADEKRHLKILLDKQVEGIIITPITTEGINAVAYNEVVNMGLPLVMIGNPKVGVKAPYVKVDNTLGGKLAAEYLLRLGHRHFAYVTYSRAELQSHKKTFHNENIERYEGFMQVLAAQGLGGNCTVVEVPETAVADEQTIRQILGARPHPTALFAYSDLIAIHTMRMLERQGFLLPRDFSLVGFDDVEIAALVNPSLTTIAQPKKAMGMIGAQTLLRLITGQPAEATILVPELLIRASSGPLSLGFRAPAAATSAQAQVEV